MKFHVNFMLCRLLQRIKFPQTNVCTIELPKNTQPNIKSEDYIE